MLQIHIIWHKPLYFNYYQYISYVLWHRPLRGERYLVLSTSYFKQPWHTWHDTSVDIVIRNVLYIDINFYIKLKTISLGGKLCSFMNIQLIDTFVVWGCYGIGLWDINHIHIYIVWRIFWRRNRLLSDERMRNKSLRLKSC